MLPFRITLRSTQLVFMVWSQPLLNDTLTTLAWYGKRPTHLWQFDYMETERIS